MPTLTYSDTPSDARPRETTSLVSSPGSRNEPDNHPNPPKSLGSPIIQPPNVRAIGYLRVSTDDQSAGIDSQREKITDYCAARAYGLTRLAIDEGISGKTIEKRPALVAALADLKSGKADALIVAKLDRLCRSVLGFAQIMEDSRRQGWSLIVIDAEIDTSTPSGKMVMGVLALFAEFERELIGVRTRDALKIKRAQGVQLGRRHAAKEPEVLSLIRTYSEPSDEATARRLNAEQVPTTTGRGKWTGGSVRRLINRWS